MAYFSIRGGTPNIARKIRERRELSIVAFGTSISNDGHYLAALGDSLSSAFGANVKVETIGLRSSSSGAAIFHVDRVLAVAPDLVILEFAVNDGMKTGNPMVDIPEAMSAMIGRIRAALPETDLLSVGFAHGEQPAGSRAAVAIHNGVAAYFGIPSIDMAQYSDDLIMSGGASLKAGPTALTTDGTHHTRQARTLLGVPFADAVVEIIRGTPNGGGGLSSPSHYRIAYSVLAERQLTMLILMDGGIFARRIRRYATPSIRSPLSSMWRWPKPPVLRYASHSWAIASSFGSITASPAR